MRFKIFDSLFVLAPMLTLACSTAAQDGASAGGSTGLSASASESAGTPTTDTTPDTTPSTTDPQGTTSGGTTTGNSGTTEALTGGPTGTTSPGTSTAPGTTTTDPGTTGGTTTGGTTDSETTTDSTTGSPLEGACEVDADCKLSTDCCACYGLPTGEEEVPTCDLRCLQSKCDELGIDQAVCRFGQCTTEKLDCSSPVACDALPPECPEGTVPGVGDGCWTGACVPAENCDLVPNCALCPESTMCVEYQAQISTYACEPIPAACKGEPNCECASEVCVDLFNLCLDAESPADLLCHCPAC